MNDGRHSRVMWTTREWALIAGWLLTNAKPVDRLNPRPRILVDAQRAVLPTDRHRPALSMSGRLNRAHTTAKLAECRLSAADLHSVVYERLLATSAMLRAVATDVAELEARVNAEIIRRQDEARIAAASKKTNTKEREAITAGTATKTIWPRVDVVGLIRGQVGDCTEYVRGALGDAAAKRLRFVNNNVAAPKHLSFRAVLVVGFISHSMDEAYTARLAPPMITRVYTPSAAGAAAVALLQRH